MITTRAYSIMEHLTIKNALLAFAAYRAYKMVYPTEVKSLEGKTVLVTGAGGGLGLAVIQELRNRKCGKMILWDIKQDALDRAAKEAGNHAHVTMIVDMSKREAIYEAIKSIPEADLPHYIFNIAGIVSGKYVCENSDEIDLLTFHVNALAHLWMIKGFLPLFEKRGEGHFVNVSSMAAFVGATGMVAYASSKSAAMMICQSLNHELKHRNSPVKITSVCPSHFHTPLFEGFEYFGNLSMTPEYVAQKLIQGTLAERELVILPQYLISTWPSMALFQMNGFLNIVEFDKKNPMKKWGGSNHASDVFRAMGASL